ncbi:bile acid:sodium symporter [Pseudomonas sp. WN033]|nr:bile acid:sodium symporter [Pseudomonas sp. WN033]
MGVPAVDRLTLERHQVWLYLSAITLGLGLGQALPGLASQLELLLWPTLVALLFCTFLQVPLLHVRTALGDRRFVSALLCGNFIAIPLLVWALLQWLPNDPALRLGVLLVLLVPCTDWFISFTQLGRGDTARAIAVTPLNLLLQVLLLPLYLWLLSDTPDYLTLAPQLLAAAVLVVLLPLLLAAMGERWIEAQAGRERLREHLAWWPVPLLALVIALIAASQAETLINALPLLPSVVPVYLAYLVLALILAAGLARLWRLPIAQQRTLAFSFGTRNSFVVLPLALALPAGWEIAALVIVIQSLVELLGMLFFLWWLPRRH